MAQLAEYCPRRRRNGGAQTVAAAVLGQDESIDADHFAANVDQRAAGIARIDRRIGLDVDQWRIRSELAADGRHESVREAVTESGRAAEGEHRLALPQAGVRRQWQRAGRGRPPSTARGRARWSGRRSAR